MELNIEKRKTIISKIHNTKNDIERQEDTLIHIGNDMKANPCSHRSTLSTKNLSQKQKDKYHQDLSYLWDLYFSAELEIKLLENRIETLENMLINNKY